jgi:hypothetical protein
MFEVIKKDVCNHQLKKDEKGETMLSESGAI